MFFGPPKDLLALNGGAVAGNAFACETTMARNISGIRNIGIMAHVDAGKWATSTTATP